MRAVFGLVSLLVVITVMVVLFRYLEVPVVETGVKAQDQTRQMSGRGQDGVPAMETFKTEPKMRGSNLEALTVTSVTPGGAMADYGLQKGDEILAVDGTKIGDISVNDPETAKAMVVQRGFEANLPITVRRGNQEINLPDRGNPSNGIPPRRASSPAPAPAPSNTPAPQNNSLQGQLNNINDQMKIPTH